jgi:heme/copper-type cytochrome/quinol oxidase subunit 2
MNVVDLLITIVVVTILVTIVLAVITYIAYKLRLARQPSEETEDEGELRFFIRHVPPATGRGPEAHAKEA